MSVDMLVGRSAGPWVKYVQESYDGTSCGPAKAHLIKREWDVTDPKARLKAATEEIGPITEENRYDAQWFIDANRNMAALLVFRPKSFELCPEGVAS